jgi:hypothetical protein
MTEFEKVQEERRTGKQDYRDLKKHYVRVNGWLPIVSACFSTRGAVRYLTLCAKEAIDVRYFAAKGVLERNAEKNEYPHLTFVESDEEDYAVIAETLGRCRLGVRARLEDVLLDSEHDQHEAFLATFPYDVVNLDFCGEIMPRKEVPYSETVRCIEQIVRCQAEADPALEWHMFLTFRTHRVQHNEEANGQLKDILDGNLQNQAFQAPYGDRLPPDALMQADYPEFLRLGISKYLASCAQANRYRMSLRSSWVYGRHKGAYHIVKLVARLQPLTRPGAIPNPVVTNRAYEQSVSEIFRSAADDVEAALADAAQRSTVQGELDPVLAEIEGLGVVTA